MEILKRSGAVETYDPQKIINAMKKAFSSVDKMPAEDELEHLLAMVEARLSHENASVEQIQDLVELSLMERGHYGAAKSYRLYRYHRTELRQARQRITALSGCGELDGCLLEIQHDFDASVYSLTALAVQFSGFAKPGMDPDELMAQLT